MDSIQEYQTETYTQIRGSEAVIKVGKTIHADFDISDELIKSIYKQGYENFVNNLAPEIREKGIALVGSIGVGKSTLMRVLQTLFLETRSKFMWVNAIEFTDMIRERGIDSASEIKDMYGKNLKRDVYFDDLGMGSIDFKKYGNAINIVAEILLERYELFISSGIRTHFSSNLPLKVNKENYPGVITLQDLYGDRIIDRLTEMCTKIAWKGTSLRK
jgi:DNA replication protein DnaC